MTSAAAIIVEDRTQPHWRISHQAAIYVYGPDCHKSASVADFAIPTDPAVLAKAHAWLTRELERFSIGEGVVLVTREDPRTPDEFCEVWVQLNVPDAREGHEGEMIPVAAMAHFQSGFAESIEFLRIEIRKLWAQYWSHELDELLRERDDEGNWVLATSAH
jgi:hypothetical protein